MTDVLLNPCGDIDITDGRFTLVTGADAVRQRWLIHIRTFLTEWFLDENIGVPYVQQLFKKAISRDTVKEIFNNASLQVPGIIQVTSTVVDSLNVATRFAEVTVNCIIDGDEGPETGQFRFTGVLPEGGCEAPIEVPNTVADLQFWFDASDADNVLANDPGVALQFANKVGAGTLTGADSAAGTPTLRNSAVNGLPAVRLENDPADVDDGDHLLIAGVPAIRGSTGFNLSITVFHVFRWLAPTPGVTEFPMWALDGVRADGVTQELYNGFSTVGAAQPTFGIERVTVAASTSVYTDPAFVVTPAWLDTDTMVRGFRRLPGPGETRALFQQGLVLDDSVDSEPSGVDFNGLGVIGAEYDTTTGLVVLADAANGFWCETLVYSRSLTDDEMDLLHDYLLAKWGVSKPTP